MRPTVLPTRRRSMLSLAGTLVALAAITVGGARAMGQPDDPYAPALLSAAELDELVAPVALYPDVVLDSLLPATEAPLDVVAAARFVASNRGVVQGAPAGSTWDASLVALLQFPDVLEWMGDNPSWVEQMGFAVATAQADVLDAVQRYRARALARGALVSTENQVVAVERGTTIVIVARNPNYVYIPVYDPWTLDSWAPGLVFYRSWLSFSFGSRGLWGRYRILWGYGIYDYGDTWWWGRWRNSAADWGTRRPLLWSAPRHADQPWLHSGWRESVGIARPAAPRVGTRGTGMRMVNVTPPPPRRYTNTIWRSNAAPTARARTQPLAPAAPITRWSPRARPTPTPRVVTPPGRTAPTPAPARRPIVAPPRRILAPTPNVVDGQSVDAWRRRGRGSIQGPDRTTPPPVTTAPAPRAAPAPRVPATPHAAPAPRVPATPRAAPAARAPATPRAAPAPKATPRRVLGPQVRSSHPVLDGVRARIEAARGRRNPSGSGS